MLQLRHQPVGHLDQIAVLHAQHRRGVIRKAATTSSCTFTIRTAWPRISGSVSILETSIVEQLMFSDARDTRELMRIPRTYTLPGFCPAVHHADFSRMTVALGPGAG